MTSAAEADIAAGEVTVLATTDGQGRAQMTRQISGSACIEGQTWGQDNRGIWVDRGCRAEFQVNGRR